MFSMGLPGLECSNLVILHLWETKNFFQQLAESRDPVPRKQMFYVPCPLHFVEFRRVHGHTHTTPIHELPSIPENSS